MGWGKGSDRNSGQGWTDRKTKKDKERQKRKEIDVRWWPQEPESGGEMISLCFSAKTKKKLNCVTDRRLLCDGDKRKGTGQEVLAAHDGRA